MVMAPTGTGFGNVGGTASDKTMKFYVRRAIGGVGMIILETTTVDPSGLISKTRLRIDEDRFIAGLSLLTQKVKDQGARIAIQLSHRGGQATKEEIGDTPVAPSSVLAPGFREIPRALSVKEIHRLIHTFAEAARRAKEAGFDAVEVHGAHGLLICQFLSPAANFRKDEFGGDINGRTRFAAEIVRGIKRRVGEDFPVIFRISAEEYIENGIKLGEAKIIAGLLQDAGVDLFHVSGGHYSNLLEWVIPPMMQPQRCLVPLAAGIKEAVTVPVMAVGGINDPLLAERILEEGKADLIAMSRALIADPDFPRKAREKREKEIRKCIACNTCIDRRVRLKTEVRCAINPEIGRDEEYEYKSAPVRKKVFIIGGGSGRNGSGPGGEDPGAPSYLVGGDRSVGRAAPFGGPSALQEGNLEYRRLLRVPIEEDRGDRSSSEESDPADDRGAEARCDHCSDWGLGLQARYPRGGSE